MSVTEVGKCKDPKQVICHPLEKPKYKRLKTTPLLNAISAVHPHTEIHKTLSALKEPDPEEFALEVNEVAVVVFKETE